MRISKSILWGVALVLVAMGPAAAQASEPTATLQEQIDQVLHDFPGGVQIAANQVSWDDGSAILTLASANSRAVGTCATGAFCAYSLTSFGGSKLSFTSCSATNSTGPVSPVKSIANARTSGTVNGYNGSSVSVSVGAGSWVNTTATVTRLGC